jgi:DNA-binding ferritin-like protein (Dps family)
MKLSKHIHLEKGFQNSVNLAYDLDDTDKIESFIPTIASIDLIEEIMLSTVDNSNNRAKILIGAYGKGKSHLVLVLLAMLQNKNKNLFERLLNSIQVENLELYNFINVYFKSNKRLLPVIVKGTSSSITQSFLSAMEQALKCEELEDLMPETHFNAVVNMIEKWEKEYPSTYNNLLKLINEPITDFIERVERFDNGAYLKFEGFYPKLTSGGTFNPILGFDVIELYKQVNKSLIKRGYNGMFVVYDEFSKYLESNISNTSISDTRTLQDFAEMCNRSKEEQIHLLLIVHKDISNYIDKLPKQKVDGWRGVSERF